MLPEALVDRLLDRSVESGGARAGKKKRGENLENPIERIEALGAKARTAFDSALRAIHELASEDGIRVLVSQIRREAEGDAAPEDPPGGSTGMVALAATAWLDHPRAFARALEFHRADELPARSWWKRVGLPKVPPATDHKALDKFARSISSHYTSEQWRGRRCTVEHSLRGESDHYFFAYPDDYPSERQRHDENGKLVRETSRPTFENVFIFDPSKGSLQMYAKGGKPLRRKLEQIFGREILGRKIAAEDAARPPYRLGDLMKGDFAFPTDPADGIREVRITSMKLAVVGNERRKITLDASLDGGPDDLREMLRDYLNHETLPLRALRVVHATIRISFDDGGGRPRTLSFEVGAPNSCNLRSKPDRMRALGEKYLERWGIDTGDA